MKIYSNWADGAYDASFKRNGVTYYIQMEQGDSGNVVATWWDTSDNGLGYNNRGFIMLDLPFGMHKSDITPDNVIQYLGVNSSFDRRPNKPIADMLKKKAASLYVGVNSSKRSSGKYVKADEYYPENYAEMGYDGLDDAEFAVEDLDTMMEDLNEAIAGLHDALDDNNAIEWFGGPDEAKAFTDRCNNIHGKLYKAWELLVQLVDDVQ